MTTIESDVIVSGKRIRLRRKRLSDASSDYAWRRDPALARYDAARPTQLTYEEFLANYTRELLHPQAYRRTYAVEDHSALHIGNVMYYNIDLSRREAELGITIGNPDYWGRGYGSEAVDLFVDHVFTETAVTRIYLHTLDWNVRAQRAFENAGFRHCGRSKRGAYRFQLMELRREWRWEREYQHHARRRGY